MKLSLKNSVSESQKLLKASYFTTLILQHMADVVQLGIVAIGHGLQKQLDDLLHVL